MASSQQVPTRDVTDMARYFEIDKELPYDRSLLFIGATGAGKSTLCNFLVKKDVFEAKASMSSVTLAASSYYFEFGGLIYKVIDCPGFMDNEEKNQHRVLSEICRAGVLAKDGLDAIVFVIDGGSRFSDQRHEQAIYILNALGDNFWKYSFIIFTHEASMKDGNNSSSDAYLKSYFDNPEHSGILLKIYNQVNGRNMKIELVSSECSQNNQYWDLKLEELVAQVGNIRTINESIRFDCELMHSGKNLYAKCYALLMENKSLQKQLDDLNIEIEFYKVTGNQDQQKIAQCSARRKQLEKERGSVQKRIECVRKELNEKVNKFEDHNMKKWFALSTTIVTVIALFGIVVLKIFK